ncbi:hypothetical protein ABI_24510 [Asticcacaulis biprosthecium C19]|uniref:Uncharacterized protein n=1 Tax=Asticcacaulis biprosthecium C19 TaxID=715226 RepID=F4QNY0_9CAUL|nr:hypothetical protein ABI_24510 [Asticcacaulis biprosthecium C19]
MIPWWPKPPPEPLILWAMNITVVKSTLSSAACMETTIFAQSRR